MRRWAVGALRFLVLGVLALGGCGDRSGGLDGDLTDDWQPMAAATPFRPQAGVCHADLVPSVTVDSYAPVPCAESHLAETVAVATVSTRSPARAFATCSAAASAFLGGDWRTGWVVLQPVLPSKAAWAGGARWVRCDVAETSPVDGALVHRAGSLKGSVQAGGRLRMGCANPTVRGDTVTQMHPAACSSGHTAEFAGLFTTTRARSDDLSSAEVAKGCGRAIARFAGIADDASLPSRVGWLGFPPDDAAWQMGDRSIRCFLWLNGEKMTGSYRGAGPGKLKIHYVSG